MTDPVEVVRAALEAHDCRPRGTAERGIQARCPAHDDRNPSLTLTAGRDGTALLTCHASCDRESIVRALGLEWADLFPESRQRDAEWTPVSEYVYRGADGGNLFKVVRFAGKNFRQQRWNGHDWEWGMAGVTRQLYRLPEVLRAKERGDFIFVCEGEKDAEAVVRAGQCGTTNPGGAGKWEPQYTETLTGAKVIVLADDDGPGREHAALVTRALHGKAAGVWNRMAAAGHKDVAAHLLAGLSLNGDLRKWDPLADRTLEAVQPSRNSALTAAVFAARPASAKALQVLGPLMQRGMRTVIGAQTGEGKTTLALQAVRCLIEGKPFLEDEWRPQSTSHRALIVDLEQGEETLKARLRESGLDTSERVDILWEPSGISLDRREEDRAMIHDVLREGHYDLVVFDPLYQMHEGSGNDEVVAATTMRQVDAWAQEFNAAFVVPMHARKPPVEQAGKAMTIHDIAGVGTWLRNAEFVLGLQLMFAGESRVWFFKDRIGRGPEIRSYWYLDWARDEGFKRSHKEAREKLKRQIKKLLKDAEGVAFADLLQAADGNEIALRRVLSETSAHEQDGRWRSRPWPGVRGQTMLG